MPHKNNREILEITAKIAKLDSSAKGDVETIQKAIDDGCNTEAHEVLTAEIYLEHLMEGETCKA